ncbi:DUF3037 domain-containing protein [Clostridium perfringens]|uniref:DUF3037 domain-containing protein n=1 Tax=Clostridium perfringens TaxID=1502 RepID=UPI0018AB3F81|nr:DUF3037 domain-containing protein [Clostridium perfringens]MBI5984599.1 DUF3037 domain-containing protein [Clostridium perfringens]
MIKIAYSVLSHYPSLINDECINLGIVFHNINENKYVFEYTHNWKRISTFNDELDISFLKIQLKEMKREIEETLSTYGRDYKLQSFTQFYVNELKFSKVTNINYEDFDSFINASKKLYLRFDFDKKDRYSKDQELALMKKFLKSKNLNNFNKEIHGFFNEKITFDFVINEYAFKIFSFRDKSATHLTNSVKSWAYNAVKLKDKYKFTSVIDLDYTEMNDSYKLILDILKEESQILNYKELIPFIESINKIDKKTS